MTAGRLALLRGAVAVAAIVGAVVFLMRRRGELAALESVGAGELAALVASVFAFFVVSGWIFAVLVGALSVRLSVREWLGLTIVTNALNYLAPVRPGVVFKAVYLKGRGLSYARFSAVLAAAFFLSLTFTGLAGLVVIAALALSRGLFSPVLAVACVGLVAASVAPLLIPLGAREGGGRLRSWIGRAVQGFQEIRRQRGKIAAIGAGVTLQHLLSAASCWISFRALGFDLDFLTALCLGILLALSNVAALTPNNIGLQELILAYLYSMTGEGFAAGLLGAGLIRAVHIALAFGLAPYFWRVLHRDRGPRG